MTDISSTPIEAAQKSSNYYEMLAQEEIETVPSFSKTNRKKLKKLRKRATNVLVESERSGLLTPSEYEEYQTLMQMEKDDNTQNETNSSSDVSHTIPPAHPFINLRTKCSGIEKVEGATHRDLLSWLLQQKFDTGQQQQTQKKSKKRGRDEHKPEVVAIPHWASVHNPGTCEQVTVLEIHLLEEKLDACRQFLESCQDENNKNALPNCQVSAATKWFQGHMPKSMSEALLYFSNAKKEHKKKKEEDDSSFPSKSEFLKRLENMLLSSQEMNEQGYPIGLPPAGGADTKRVDNLLSRTKTIQSPDSISLKPAKEYVASFGVRIEEQNEEDKSLFISTCTVSTEDSPVRVLALDCEMVLTTVGSELARVTLIEFEEFIGPKTSSKTTILLDCLVCPENKIVDYLTKHSGITSALLEPVSTRLQQVQCALASYLTPNDILIGHSLENDLRALHYIHPRIVDTSMVFRPQDQNKRFKFSLRHLSGTLLKKPIQAGSHCSEEDAQTALDLALLKALRGDIHVPGFGDNQRQSLLRQSFVKDSVAAFIGPNHWLEKHITKHPTSAHALNYDNPNDCKRAFLAWMTNKRKAHLVWSRIELEKETNSLEVVRSLVTEIVEKLPPHCILMVALQGESQTARNMFKRRGACRDPRSSIIWTDTDEENWRNLLNSTRVGYVHWFSPTTKKA